MTEYMIMLRRLTGNLLPEYCIKYHAKSPEGFYRYAIRMPLTSEWEIWEIPAKFVKNKCIPVSVQARLDYWVKMRKLMEYGRDFAPMSGDLNPITPDERNIFDARVIEPNPIFPRLTRARLKKAEQDYWDKFRGDYF